MLTIAETKKVYDLLGKLNFKPQFLTSNDPELGDRAIIFGLPMYDRIEDFPKIDDPDVITLLSIIENHKLEYTHGFDDGEYLMFPSAVIPYDFAKEQLSV